MKYKNLKKSIVVFCLLSDTNTSVFVVNVVIGGDRIFGSRGDKALYLARA